MSERHVADPELVVHAQQREAVEDEMAALQAEQSGNLSAFMNPNHVVRCAGYLDIARIALGFLMERVDAFHCARQPQLLRVVLRLHIDAEQHGADAPALQSRNVGFIVGVVVRPAVTFIDRVARRIDVGIEDKDVAHQPFKALLKSRGLKQKESEHEAGWHR